MNSKKSIQIAGDDFKKIVDLSRKIKKYIVPLGRRIDNLQIIEQAAILAAFKPSSLDDENIGKELSKYLALRLNTVLSSLKNNWKVEYLNKSLIITGESGGIINTYKIDKDFIGTPEAIALNNLRKPLMNNFAILKSGLSGFIKSKDQTFEINGPVNLIEKIIEFGKKGLNINRYKGLGEMNPDQLWDTTLDKESRSLLLVKIGEASEADSLLSTLMGDEVEGRKIFIQENSQKVSNLDI